MAMYDPSKSSSASNSKSNGSGSKPLSEQVDLSQIITGYKMQGAKQYQEDSFCTFESPDLTFLVAGVFDGHGGLNGQVASLIVAKLCKAYFAKHWRQAKEWSDQQWTTQMETLYEDIHTQIRHEFVKLEILRRKQSKMPTTNVWDDDRKVVRKSSGFPVHGGTTCTIVCIIRTESKWRIVSSNTGDSDALLLSRKPSRLLRDNAKQKHLSVDHSPDNASEYLRIKRLPTDAYPTKLLFVYDKANTCRKFECPIVFCEDGTKDPKYVRNPWGNHLRPTNVRYDPAVYAVSPYGVSHDITCIAMTRSLGDFYAHQFGLTNRPSVTFEELDIRDAAGECNEYIVSVGSDGVWDCWKWDDFSDYVNGVMTKLDNKLQAVNESVLKHTVQRAKACFGEGSYDDATLISVALRPQLFEIASASEKKKDKDEESKETAAVVPIVKGKDNDEKEEVSVKGLDDEDDE